MIGILGVTGLVFTALHYNRDDTTAVVTQQAQITTQMKALNDELRAEIDECRAERERLRRALDRSNDA